MSMVSRPSRALIAYSVLAERLKKNGATYFQALTPFLVMACKGLSGQMYEAAQFAKSVNDLFGIRIPRLMALGLADQLCAEGYLENISNGRGAVFKYTDKVDALDESEIATVTESQVEAAISHFVEYVENNSKGVSLDRAYLEEAFLNRLLNIDSMKILSRKEYRVGLKSEKSTIVMDSSRDVESEARDELHLDFLVSDFLMDIADKNPNVFDLISNVAFASMAAEALICFSEPPEKAESLRDVTIYLDTPLILDILGVNAEYAEYGTELLGLLNDCGAKISVMDHCIVEAENAIAAQHDSMMSGIGRRSNQLSGSIKPEVLSALRGSVSERASRYGITHVSDPEINLHKKNERATGTLQTSIQNRMAAWGNEEAKRHDEKSVLSVIAVRNSIVATKKFSECGSVFLTRNSALVDIANSAWVTWLRDTTTHNELTRAQWAPIALSDKQFAGFIWMIKGGASSIPRTRLLAHCAAAMRPRNDVKTRAYNLILETYGKQEADHFAALIEERDSGRALMRATTGDPLDVTRERLPYIFDVVKKQAGEYAAAEERARAEKERVLLVDDYSKKIVDAKRQSAEIHGRLLQSDIDKQQHAARASTLEGQLRDVGERERARINSILTKGFTSGCREFRSAKFLSVLIFISIALLFSSIGDFPSLARLGTVIVSGSGFWFVPGLLAKPIFWLANRRMIKVIKSMSPDFEVPLLRLDFEKKVWTEIDS